MTTSITAGAREESLEAALDRLRRTLIDTAYPLEVPAVSAARRDRDALLHQLDDYLLPRVRSLDAPLLTVVGGSTGAGKSTLVNAIVGRRVSEPGVLRPTTRSPVLVHHPDDARWFVDDRVLPGLTRTTGVASDDQGALHLVADDGLPPGLALLDAPDVDSVVTANRALAGQLLAAADLWLFVTTAARYADAVPWDLLRDAAHRSAAVAVVLDRVPLSAVAEIRADLARLLAEERLGASPLFVVPETDLVDGALPYVVAAEVRDWLHGLAVDAVARREVVRRTLDGALRQVAERIGPLAAALDEQAAARTSLRSAAEVAYSDALHELDRATRDGSMLRGEVLARWQEFVGTGELMRSLEERLGRFRDRVSSFLLGRPQPAVDMEVAIEQGVEALARDAAERAAEDAARAWSADAAGRALIATAPTDLGRPSPGLGERVAAEVRAWQGGVLEMVRTEAGGKRSTARLLSFSINGVAVALMVVAFAHTGGLVGAEVGIAAGTAVVGQRVLEALFGDEAVRDMAERARTDLRDRVQALLLDEQQRYADVLEAAFAAPGALAALPEATDLRAAGREVEALRSEVAG